MSRRAANRPNIFAILLTRMTDGDSEVLALLISSACGCVSSEATYLWEMAVFGALGAGAALVTVVRAGAAVGVASGFDLGAYLDAHLACNVLAWKTPSRSNLPSAMACESSLKVSGGASVPG